MSQRGSLQGQSVLKKIVLIVALICLVVGMASAVTPPPVIALEPFISGLSSPIDFQVAKDGSGRFFVVEQGGTIRIIKNKKLVAKPFLNITSLVVSGGEEGLLGLAFHPSYKTNGRFFVNYTRMVGAQIQTVIAEYHQSTTNRDLADPDRSHSAHRQSAVRQSQGWTTRLRSRRFSIHRARRRRRHRRSI